MVAPGRGGGQNHTYSQSQANIKQAQLTSAYQELARELGSENLKVVGGYTLGRVIGEGSYGSVHIATHRLTGHRTAIKKIPKSFTPHLTREIHHHRRLHHQNVVHLHEIIATESHIWLVTELCSGGELFDYLVERGRMLEGEARRLFGELAVAVGWLHKEGVVHRDLKLENVLLDGELRVKLGDLGFAREWQKGRLMDTYCGTTGYASPEMLACRKYLGVETDIWSLGIILYILLCGGLPFDDDDERVMKELIQKGEYEEPDWLSEDARALIRGMLQQDPSNRLTIEEILTHPWFEKTLVDRAFPNGDSHSIPPSSNPASPQGNHSQSDEFFAENAIQLNAARHLTASHAKPSPLSTNVPTTPVKEESEPSGSSANGDSLSGSLISTTPPTTTEEDDIVLPRHNSAEFSTTEKELELLHRSNSHTSTIRQVSTTPSRPGSISRGKASYKSSLDGQVEEDEQAEILDGHTSLPLIDEHLHLNVALHSRTPSRTKRRSVSSTLSLERRFSHHSVSPSTQYVTYPPEDYFAKLNETRPPHFSAPSEKALLNQMRDMGIDIGQLRHSVETEACDSSAGTWWILRAKQAERGETDQVILEREKERARKREKAVAIAEKKRAREGKSKERDAEKAEEVRLTDQPMSIPATPSFGPIDLGPPVSRAKIESPEPIIVPGDSPGIEMATISKPPLGISINAPISSTTDVPDSPVGRRNPSPDSPQKDRERLKSRSPSMNMLQRATSAFTSNKKGEEKEKADRNAADSDSFGARDEKGNALNGSGSTSGSPTKLRKPNPLAKLPKSESDGLLSAGASQQASPAPSGSKTITPGSSPQRVTPHATPRAAYEARDLHEEETSMATQMMELGEGSNSLGKGKGGKRDSIWNTFRHLFHEDRRRRKREATIRSPLSSEIKVPPAVILSRGPNSRTPAKRFGPGPSSRRTSLDGVGVGGRPAYSRRSSSVNSRRSSMGSMQLEHPHPHIAELGRKRSGRSHGSQTPTSDREFVDHPISRPGSSHSLHRGGSRRSSMSIRSPSLTSETSTRFKNPPQSPLLSYRRRPAGGNDSSRVRHIKVIPESQIMRSSSVASSIRSTGSSRASSVDFDYESGRDRDDASSFRSGRRQKRRSGSQRSLAQQIHRTRSPLALNPDQLQQQQAAIMRKKPIRDVFQNKGKGKGPGREGEDSEWVSEDENEFACGLGQVTRKGGGDVMWMSGPRSSQSSTPSKSTGAAASFPSSKIAAPVSMSGRRRERGRRGSSDEEREGGSNGSSGKKKDEGLQGLGLDVRSRRNLPGRGTTAPGIIEEEEEDEE
ncbi:hypothetical protein L202_02273 [Cryptococcus amylolentus CBS 6039]|uniref:Protein kinase domain-containing protein n=1 Tax=Cryptococcus amylolentus CBS 6039 TaxID=1295533 RepID=A0A1E3I028_9TREE|nr:hypothetical protein L202_02273 [Cryptococcus amylolentus CBS 6039]ODN81930.1 hypothetical protein L202_02273 [Cryptococcus amylolentus CBS 6039]